MTHEGAGTVRSASPPLGEFRTTPVVSDGVMTVSMGNPVTINGARFVDPDPGDELKVEVMWGDGQQDHIGCGPCRLSHVYARPGVYELSATIHDRRLADRGSVVQDFRVVVVDPNEAPAPSPSAPSLTTGACYDSSAGDLDFTFNGPINQSNNTVVHTSTNGSCAGFSTNAMMVYFEGTQSAALAFCQSINPAVTFIENSQARGYPVPNAFFWGCL